MLQLLFFNSSVLRWKVCVHTVGSPRLLYGRWNTLTLLLSKPSTAFDFFILADVLSKSLIPCRIGPCAVLTHAVCLEEALWGLCKPVLWSCTGNVTCMVLFWEFFLWFYGCSQSCEVGDRFSPPVLVGFAACTCNFRLVSRLKIHCLSELLGTVEEGQSWTCSHAENICLPHNSIIKCEC